MNKVQQVYNYVGLSILLAAVGAYIGTINAAMLIGFKYWGLVILEFVLLLSLFFVKKARTNNGVALALLSGFTFISGVTLGPTLSIVLGLPQGSNILIQTLAVTGVMVIALSIFAKNTSKDFSAFSQIFFIALIALVVLGIINIFIGSSLLSLIISWVGVVLFSGYIIMDTQTLLKEEFDSPVIMAISLYLDILNLFISLLNIISSSRD